MPSRADAEAHLFGAIAACAESAEDTKDGDLLKTAAEAFREVAHGPSGGRFDRTDDTRTSSTSRAENHYRGDTHYDYHETHHRDGEERPRLGFQDRQHEAPTEEMPRGG